MKNKGFTLIELLAVIVILAIIALIATPIILGIIKDAKENANKRSAENYIDAINTSIVSSALDNKKISDGEYNILSDGNICLGILVNNVCDGDTLKVEMDGEVPTGGTIIIDNGTVSDGTALTIGKTTYKKENGELVKENEESIPEPVSFKEDSWKTISLNVQAGNIEVYKKNLEEDVNNTKTVDMGIYGTHTVRIANTSTPDECKTEGFSQTACGFVVEFEDIITTHNMNSIATNVGGYPASEMYKFINEEKEDTTTSIYESLPKDLKNVIIDTKVISSHGSTSGETNFVSIDKLYLLSTKEVWGKKGASNVINYDTAEAETRQLDYYEQEEVTTNSGTYAKAIKEYNGSATWWWLRSADSGSASIFYRVSTSGRWDYCSASSTNGVAVAFRIG